MKVLVAVSFFRKRGMSSKNVSEDNELGVTSMSIANKLVSIVLLVSQLN